MAVYTTLIAAFSLFTLFSVAFAKPLASLIRDDRVSNTCPDWCWSKSNYGNRIREQRCPTPFYKECTRASKSEESSSSVLSGLTCDCSRDGTIAPPTTGVATTTKATTTLATSPTNPTVPPNAPGNAPYGTPTPAGRVMCGTTILSGCTSSITFQVDIKKAPGADAVIVVEHQMYEIPDGITLSYMGAVKKITGEVQYDDKFTVGIQGGSSSIVDVTVTSATPLSAWDFSVSCA